MTDRKKLRTAVVDALDALIRYERAEARAEPPAQDLIAQEHAAHSCYWPRRDDDTAREAIMCPMHQRQEAAEAELAAIEEVK